jgi:hypothetical protein
VAEGSPQLAGWCAGHKIAAVPRDEPHDTGPDWTSQSDRGH